MSKQNQNERKSKRINDVVAEMFKEKRVLSTKQVLDKIGDEYGVTQRKVYYRIETGAFSPVPEKLEGSGYVWEKKHVRALMQLLEGEHMKKMTKGIEDDSFFQYGGM